MAGMTSLDTGSRHIKARATCSHRSVDMGTMLEATECKPGLTFGGVEAVFTPTVIASTPASFSTGITDLVMPGTSRWLSVILGGKPG